MKELLSYVLLVILVGCSSNPVRSQWTDKNMRIMIDPDSLNSSDYVDIQNALVQENKFMVVDRSNGFKAIKAEQERLHRNESDRYSDRQKWAHWGKMYGVGAIVVGHSQCFKKKKLFSFYSTVDACKQYLSLIDANTGEVIVAVDGLSETPAEGNNFGYESFKQPQSWQNVVSKFVDAYPKNYKAQYYSEGLLRYQEISKEEAQRQKDLRKPAAEK